MEAAKQLQNNAPEAANSPEIRAFANVSPTELTKLQQNFSAAAEGQTPMLHTDLIPPDVAAAVAADSLRNQPSATRKNFSDGFAATWGQNANENLILRLNPELPSAITVQNVNKTGATSVQF